MALVLSNNALLTLPQELFLEIIQYLNLSSVHQLGAVCKDLHQKIHQNEELWFRRVRFELKLFIIDPDYSGPINSDHWKIQPNGVIQVREFKIGIKMGEDKIFLFLFSSVH